MTKSAFQLIMILLVLLAPAGLAGWGFEMLHAFEKPGTQPLAALVSHTDGNFYGTTVAGGAHGMGAVFQMTPAGAVTTLFSFSGTDGSGPIAELCMAADGTMYGTASSGGAGGFGVVYKITTDGVFTKLVDFTGTSGAAKGSVPGGLVLHSNGLFYGTTQAGGGSGFGTVFSMTAVGAVTTLVEFTGTAGAVPGAMPVGRLAVSGNTLYGMTNGGGANGLGTVFKVTTAGAWTSMAVFTGAAGAKPGSNPTDGVVLHSGGILYGVTEYGGTTGFGVAFKLTTAASPVFTVLRNFADPTGSQPVGRLVEGGDGALYGMTSYGGTGSWGTVFRLTTAGVHSVLANFTGETGATAGAAPRGSLIVSGGDLHGATSAGGPGESGVLFKVTLAGSFTHLANFSLPLGWTPAGALVEDGVGGILFPMAEGGDGGGGTLVKWSEANGVELAAGLGGTLGGTPDGGLLEMGGVFYGVTSAGGGAARGTAFQYDAVNGASLVADFTTASGSLSEGALATGTDGALYGVSREGGSSARGTVYRLTTAGVRTRLVSFTGPAGAVPGRSPRGPLARAANGDFYGLTELGGSSNSGVIFRISNTGTYTVLAAFGATGPRLPQGGLVAGTDGFLYGTTSAGGSADAGTVLRVNPANDTWAAVAEFATGLGNPSGELAVAADGRIWGMSDGGVFSYSATAGLETVVALTDIQASADPGGGVVLTGGLLPQADGSVLGVAAGGGSLGGGVLFRITPLTPMQDWKLAELGDFNCPELGDPDHDGLVNLLEYAFGLSPVVPDIANAPQPEIRSYVEGQRLSVIVPRDPARTDITINVESSPDLMDPWTPLATSIEGQPFTGPGYFAGDSATPGVKSVEIRGLTNIGSPPRNFIRIRVSH